MQSAPPTPRSSASGASSWRHVTADLAGIRGDAFTNASRVEANLVHALGAIAAGIRWTWHRFDPTGVSVVGMGPHVRVALHTWPETKRATVDVYAPVPDLEGVLSRVANSLLSA
jgi:S-adenosylmethionine/arginine decarboxylase-like enzyme